MDMAEIMRRLNQAEAEALRLRHTIACQKDLLSIAADALAFYHGGDPRNEPAAGALARIGERRVLYCVDRAVALR